MKITIDYKFDNWNDTIKKSRTNYAYANKAKQKEMDVVRYYLLNVPKITKYPVKMIFKWHIKSIISDLDNKSVKSILDQMQHSGILENDNIKYIREITYVAIPDNKDYVEIEILPYSEDDIEKLK